MFKRFYQAFLRRIKARRIAAAAAQGHVHPKAFEEIINFYRKKGYQIGNGVRLLGRLDSVNPHFITIGDYCVIGSNSMLLTHCPIKGAKPCCIGNYVFLGYGVIVLPGVTINDFSVIGAGSVVTKDIPEGSIAAGNPARVLRKITEEEKASLIETMMNFRLFGWDKNRPI